MASSRPPPSSDPRPVTHTPTGWRIVGRAAHRLARGLSGAAPAQSVALGPGSPEQALLALDCTVPRSWQGRSAVEHLLDALTSELRETWAACPRLVRDQPLQRAPTRFGGVSFTQPDAPADAWRGRLVWRSVHPQVQGAPITTTLGLEERRNYVRLFLRISADDGVRATRGYVGAGQTRPPLLGPLREGLSPTWLGAPHEVIEVARGEVPALVHDVLENPARRVPVVVQTVLEEGGWVVEPGDLLWELFGRARLYVLPRHELTFDLTDTLADRRHSAYWGAAHAYLPDFSPHDDYHTHPLLVNDRLRDPVIRAAWLGEVGLWMAPRVELPEWVEVDAGLEATPERGTAQVVSLDAAPAPDPPRPHTAPDRADHGSHEDAQGHLNHAAGDAPSEAPSEALDRVLEGFSALAGEVARLVGETRALTDEVTRLRTISAVRSASTSAVERRLARLEAAIEEALPRLLGPDADRDEADVSEAALRPDDEGDDDERVTLFEVVEWASESHADVLEFLESASSSAAQSPYEDPERVRAIFDAMALVGRRRQEGSLGTSLKDAFADLGVDYRAGISRHTPARLRQQHRFTTRDGIPFEAEEHIALGGTYDPRRCLRIYFSSRLPDETRFVIAHVGRHFQVMTST